jgi:hypothetical protein
VVIPVAIFWCSWDKSFGAWDWRRSICYQRMVEISHRCGRGTWCAGVWYNHFWGNAGMHFFVCFHMCYTLCVFWFNILYLPYFLICVFYCEFMKQYSWRMSTKRNLLQGWPFLVALMVLMLGWKLIHTPLAQRRYTSFYAPIFLLLHMISRTEDFFL